MTTSPPPGIGDLFALLGAPNPFAGLSKSIGQFQAGVAQFLQTVETFNDTMEQLNLVAARVNGILDTVEEPLKAFVPQVTRVVRAADSMVDQLSGPIDKVAPGLSRLADTLSSPALANLPTDIGAFLDVLSDLGRRLQPLSQMAETAGGLFGFNPLGALRQRSSPRAAEPSTAPSAPATRAAAKKPAAKKPAAKKGKAAAGATRRSPGASATTRAAPRRPR
jgi:ABC-type transporter Mla subunit MlaD